jgi:EmrB/QacA subfamily drug resistance transporter
MGNAMRGLDRRIIIAMLVAAAFFMETLDATVIATALPAIAADFNTQAAHLSVGVSAYLVALTVFMPLSGWAADRFGPRRVFTSAIVIFILSSVLCALSTDVLSFTLARVLQGFGGAMMVPVGRLVVLRDTPKKDIVRAVAILTWPALLGPILGPVVGGWIATNWSWPWIFLINVPIGLLIIILTFCLVKKRDTAAPEAGAFDTAGFLLSGSGFGLLMAGIETASAGRLSLLASGLISLTGLMLLALACRHLQHKSMPLFSLTPLSIKTFRISAVGGSLFRVAVASVPFLLPLMFQLGFGMSAVEAGGLLLWLFVGNLSMKPATTWIMNRFGFRRVLLANGMMVAAGLAAMAMMTAETPYWLMVMILFISGMNRSLHFTALNTIGFADVDDQQMRDASTLFSVMQQMSRGMGIALAALILAVASWLLQGQAGEPTVADFQLALWMIAGIALLAIVDVLTLSRQAGAAILKPQPARGG